MTKIPTPLKAIRAKCLDCSCYQPREVKECRVTSCPLWPYRLGRISRSAPKQPISRKDRSGLTKETQIETEGLKPPVSAKTGISPSHKINNLLDDT